MFMPKSRRTGFIKCSCANGPMTNLEEEDFVVADSDTTAI